MPTPEFCILPYSIIPLSTDEPIWEWDIVSDTLFLSHGASQSLKLVSRKLKMADFYNMLPPEGAAELASFREGVITGQNPSLLECDYLCNGQWVNERLLVITRNSEGRATRILGKITATPVAQQLGFKNGQRLLSEAGIWVYDVRAGKIWRDETCEKILGLSHSHRCVTGPEQSLEYVHPSEKAPLKRHYDLFCNGNFLGDTITDIIRVKLSSGEYLPLLVRSSALERDDNGHATIIAGILTPSEPQISALHSLSKDDGLFHALNSMGAGQWNWDTRQECIYFCPRYVSMLGYKPEESGKVSCQWRDYIHPDDLDKVVNAREAVITSPDQGDSYECTYRMRRADGGWAWIFDRGCVTWRDADGRGAHMIGSITNITTAQAERDKLEELVKHDTLTGLRSRAFCNLEIEHIEQNNIRPVSVISVDITGLKMVNDNLGHARGDELLTKAARILRDSLRRTDCVARMGGDEFLVLLPSCDERRGQKIMKKVQDAFKKYNSIQDSLPVFAALGFASTGMPQKSLADLIAEADEAMYEDKKTHRKENHAALKSWIKECTGKEVAPDDRLQDQ